MSKVKSSSSSNQMSSVVQRPLGLQGLNQQAHDPQAQLQEVLYSNKEKDRITKVQIFIPILITIQHS